jgi:hypothetical protein
MHGLVVDDKRNIKDKTSVKALRAAPAAGAKMNTTAISHAVPLSSCQIILATWKSNLHSRLRVCMAIWLTNAKM